MKRSFERDGSPYNKRSRDSNEKLDKRSNRDSPFDERKRYDDHREYYKSLCVRNLHSKLTNEDVEKILNQEFSQFGEFNVKVTQFNGERVAYLNFKYSEHARAARYEKPNPIICDRQCSVDPVLASKYRHGPGGYEEPQPQQQQQQQVTPDRFHRTVSPRGARPDIGDKKDKFPHHLYHIEPEDDPKATRTLFIGNLNSEIEELDLREVFERYGVIEDIDIKRPAKGTNNNSYAFVKYANLDMAHKAKVHMSGKIIKTFQCKIGYGKVTPTKCLWVGGLGPWVQYDLLEKIFSSFGTIVEIDWPLNKNYAYILFDNVEAAIAACDKLRGHSLGDGDRRIKVDFSDETHVHNDPGAAGRVIVGSSSGGGGCGSATELVVPTTRHIARVGEISLICGDTYRFSSTGIAPITSASSTPSKRYSQTTDNQNSGNTIAASSGSGMTIEKATMVFEMIKCMRHVWTGRFLLKNNYFGSRMYHLRGESQMVHHFMQQHQQNRSRASVSGNGGDLRIDRKLALDNHLLDDVYLRITSGGDEGICIMLAVADTAICTSSATAVTESAVKRNLKALSAYLRIKQAAGKIILEGSTDDATGFGALHIFPPCSFSQKLLVDSSPLLTSDYGRDDFLLLILVRCY